ncbi:MAG TPA: FxSxx-COOH system tetratricopeptide repeat protein [Ktedonobacteraceae bacterium]
MGKERHSLPLPNERLKQERLLRGWTQADVAGFLGTDGYTVNRWERGRAYPSFYFRHRLCELFEKDAAALGLVSAGLEGAGASSSLPGVGPQSIFWSVPHPRNLCFTGRADMLQALHSQLLAAQSVALARTLALQGLGGIGKTQMALEYAYQYASSYRAVFWIEAETVEHITSSMLRIAAALQILERKEADQQRVIAGVQRWLAGHSQWLLIWDNLEDLDLLQRFLPSVRQGALLVTTRRQALGTLARGIDLEPLRRDEGMLFVLRRARLLKPDATDEQMRLLEESRPDEYAAAEQLVREMGGLPLALDQAGAYLEETGCSLADYLRLYRQQRVHLLQRRGLSGREHPHSVATTFLLACERVEQEQAATADLLRVCSLLHAEAIPEEIFHAGAAHLGSGLMALAADPMQFDQALASLRCLSLIQRHAQTHTLSLHRLVQAVLQEEMSEQERELWQRRAAAALNASFPEVISDVWNECERLLAHVLALASGVPQEAVDQQLAEVLRKAADYLRERARYEQARHLYQRALSISERALGTDTRVAHILGSLGLLAHDQGRYEESEACYQRAISILEQALSPEHPEIARPLANLARLYKAQGKYTEAEILYLRALFLWEQTLGPRHFKLGHPLANLAAIYLEQGKYAQVEPLCERALSIWRQAFGSEHTLIGYPLLTLARLSGEQGKIRQAEQLYRQVLHIWEQSLGAGHPLLARALNGLADVCMEQGKDVEAEALYQRALRIQEQVLGSEHPETSETLNGLANLYTRQRKLELASQAYQRALRLQEQHLGPEHPKTAGTLADLALFYQEQGHHSRALLLMERALAIFTSALGANHPRTIATRAYHALLIQHKDESEPGADSSAEEGQRRRASLLHHAW